MPSRSFAPFRQRAYLLVWIGALVSNVGTWMEVTALSYFVANHASASASGFVAAAGFLPNALLGPVGGAWADRFDRRRIIIAVNAAAVVIAGSVAVVVATGHATPRVLALFYSFRYDRALFAQLHSLVAPLLMVVATALFFMAWTSIGSKPLPGQDAQPPQPAAP